MNGSGGTQAPRRLDDLSHLFLSKAGEENETSGTAPWGPSPSTAANAPEASSPAYGAAVKQCLAGNGKELLDGSVLADDRPGAPEGVDLIFAGRGFLPVNGPVLVDITEDGTERIPLRIYTLLDWLKSHESLFLRAYGHCGISSVHDPLFLFVAPAFPSEVVRAAAAIDAVRILLLQGRVLRVNGSPGVLLRQVHPPQRLAHFFPL